MKNVKILVFALMVLMIMGSMLSVVSFSPEEMQNISPSVTATRTTTYEHITSKFVIDQNTTDPLTGEKGKYGFDSSIIVDPNASLIVKNATVYFLADVAHPRSLIVYGSFELYNATLTLSGSLIQPVYHMNVTIDGSYNHGARVEITDSKILYDGWFTVINKTENMTITNSVFDRMPGGTDYGPTPYFVNSRLYMENASFNNLFEKPSSGVVNIGNLTNSSGVSVSPPNDEYLSFVNYTNPRYAGYWDLVPVKELDILLNYSTSSNYDGTSKLEFIYQNTVLMSKVLSREVNSTIVNITNTSFGSADLSAQKIWEYIQDGEIQVAITAPHYQGTVTVNSCIMNFFIERNVVTYGIKRFDFNLDNSTIYAKDLHIAADFNLNYGVNHNRIALYNDSKLYVLNLTVENTADKLDSCIYAADEQSQVYIFRYAKIRVFFNSIPIPGMYVNATPYLVDENLSREVLAQTQIFINNLHYGNTTGSTVYAKTDEYGNAYLPLLSDIVNRSEWPNSKYVGVYNVWVNGTNSSSGGQYLNYYTMQIGLDHFPNLQIANNTFVYNVKLPFYRHVDVGVSARVLNPAPYISGRSITVQATVTNNGTQVADDVDVYVYLNGKEINQTKILSLAPGVTQTFDFWVSGSYLTVDGNYNISVEAVQVWDTNPSNNISDVSIRVGTLVISSWTVEKMIRNHIANISLNVYSHYTLLNANAELYIDSNLLAEWPNIYSGTSPLKYQWHVNGTSGAHMLYFYVNGTLVGEQSVYVYRDVDIGITNITTSPGTVYVSQLMTVTVNATNYGLDIPENSNISIAIYDPYNDLVFNQTEKFSYVGPKTFSVDFVPQSSGFYSVEATVISSEDYNSGNNMLIVTFQVNPTPFGASPNREYTYVNGSAVKIGVTIASYVYDDISAYMFVQPLNLTVKPSNVNNPIHVVTNGKTDTEFELTQSQYMSLLKGRTSISVMYFIKVVSNLTKATYVFGPYYFVLKEKPDFELVSGSLMVEENGKVLNGKSIAEHMPVTVKFSVFNSGGMPANLTYEIKDNNKTIKFENVGLLDVGAYYNVSFNFTIMGVSMHDISVVLNPNGTISERSYTNNNATVSLNVIPPALEVTYQVLSKEHNTKIYEGDHVIVVVMVLNKNATAALGRNVYVTGAEVTVQFGALGVHHGVTNSVGIARIEFVAQKTGTFKPTITTTYHGSESTTVASSYKVEPKPIVIPWIWIIIAVILIGVGVFFLYGYLSFKKESSEYMVCGNCGHLIPADAEKCPFCGAVFEKDKVECPDCGSWIDADSKFCPICGSVFMDDTDSEYDKYMALKERYEQYLGKYKEEARKYIGENYKKEEFFKWWKTHPEFISFLEWMKRQEEEIEGETVKCPVCGALNPGEAKICRVCGSVLPGKSEGEEASASEESSASEPAEQDEAEQTTEKSIMEQYREEYEKIQHPGVVSFDEWVRRKQEGRESEEAKTAGKEPAEKKPEPEPKAAAAGSRDKSVEEKVKEGYIKCQVCGALNKPDAKICAVCGSPLEGKKENKDKKEGGGHSKPIVKKKVIKKVVTVKKE